MDAKEEIPRISKKLGKLNEIFNIRAISYAVILLNLVSFVLGIVYLTSMSYYTVIWDIFGVLYLITLFGNFLLVYVDSIRVNKADRIGNRISMIGYIYLAFMVLSMGAMFMGNFLYSVTYPPELVANLGAFILIYLGFFGGLIFGLLVGYINLKNYEKTEIWDTTKFRKTNRGRKLLKYILMAFCYLILLVGVYFAAITLFGADLGYISGAIGMFVAQLDLFFVFITLSVTIFLLKLKDRKLSPKSYYGVAIVGLVLSGIFMAPLCSTQFAINAAETNFSAAFGSNWRDKIPTEVATQYFLQTPFSTPVYFLGMVSNNYRVNANILFYDAEGIQLYFDAYLPPVDGSTLPGNNSVIIRIHGGGWTQGDKGLANMMQMNKYFAAQGYVVFDIQYGLHDDGAAILPTPAHVLGNFTVDDMMRHIGNFTKYLADHASEYNANLDSVFISGGSAGGHLTCAVGLAITSGNYSDIFGDGLNIKGLVPYYPANGHPERFGGREEFINPDQYLVTASSPPSLVFQGYEDGLVHPIISQNLKDAYIEAENPNCAVLFFPFAGHAADLYFTGHYNQVFLYYMERFLYLCVNDYI